MTTAADTNILLDVFIPNSEYTLDRGFYSTYFSELQIG